MRFIGELRQAWRRDVNPPDGACFGGGRMGDGADAATADAASAGAARAGRAGAIADRCFNYIRVGHDGRRLRFDADGWISEGGAQCETLWWMHAGELVIADPHGAPTCRLLPRGDGFWEGRWLNHERMPIRLYPATG